jgi:hypothetical protein
VGKGDVTKCKAPASFLLEGALSLYQVPCGAFLTLLTLKIKEINDAFADSYFLKIN